MSFEEKVQKWVSLDNQIKILNDKLKQLRENKHDLNNEIMSYVDEQGLSRSTIRISDGRLRFGITRVPTPLSFKYIEGTLAEVIKNKEQLEQIVGHLKNKREIKNVQEIKRYANK